ncbi:MAG: tRNA 4-thiouridine(8) synthase ThiI [Patescibacteria group bacterium]|nr:tRNA 4-thiouridine(8) synthase ThiI [Patescibacteria group bacterium]
MDLIIHPDEIFLKGGNQPFFYRCLLDNLKKLFPFSKFQRVESGILAEKFKGEDAERLKKIPGISNFARATKVKSEVEELKKAAGDFVFSADIKTFRITANRTWKGYELSSYELEKRIGDYIRIKKKLKVDLKNYDIDIRLNIGKNESFVYTEVVSGAGGLPTGSSGKVLCLLSGGIDSPVAAYQMMKRGAEVVLAHFQNQTTVLNEVSQKIFDLALALARYQPKVKLIIIPFAEYQKETVKKIPADCRMITVRRLFFKIAEKIAKKERCGALITGDSLGQVASQTLENMNAIYSATDMLKFPPLIGTNKREIMNIAADIGALEISNRPYEDCCSLFVARHPVIKSNIDKILEIEKRLDFSNFKADNFEEFIFKYDK